MSSFRLRLQSALERFVKPLDSPLELFLISNRVIENLDALSNAYPTLFGIVSMALPVAAFAVGSAVFLKHFLFTHSDPITIDLRNPEQMRQVDDQPVVTERPKAIGLEVDYFVHFFETAEAASTGDEIKLSIWPGSKLHLPVGNALPRFAEICSRKGLKPKYIHNFTEREFARITEERLATWLSHYAFAEVELVVLSHRRRSQYGIPRRARFNIVLLPQQQIAFTHRRTPVGIFTRANRHEGKHFEYHKKIFDQLPYVTISTHEGLNRCRGHRVQKTLKMHCKSSLVRATPVKVAVARGHR